MDSAAPREVMIPLHFKARFLGSLVIAALAVTACSDVTPAAGSMAPGASATSGAGPAPTVPAPQGTSGIDGGPPDVATGDASATPDAATSDGGIADGAQPDVATPPLDPCPNLPAPGTLFNRSVMYREWNLSSVGDGTYFTSQAPYRLGFTRVQNRAWIVKFRTEANSYVGKISAGSDSVGGLSWISKAPDDVSWALANDLVAWSGHGDSLLRFVVVKDDADANKLATDSSLTAWRGAPQLRGDHCYYFGFENATTYPAAGVDAAYWNSSDDCGATGNGTCWYLGIDFGHFLHDPASGTTMSANVIPGLTH